MAPPKGTGKKPKADKYFGSHEIQPRKETIKGSSNRNFGTVFAIFFALIGAYVLYKSGDSWKYWLAAAAAMAGITIVAPNLLAWPNRMWSKVGLLMSKVISPLTMGVLFYLVITPIGVVMRFAGKDLLSLKWDPEAESYWIKRDPPGPSAESLRNQF